MVLNARRKRRKNIPTNYRLSKGGHTFEPVDGGSSNCSPSKRPRLALEAVSASNEIATFEGTNGLTAESYGTKVGSIIKNFL